MAEAVGIKRYPFAPGVVSQRRLRVGETAGRYDEVRAQESPTVTLPVRSSVAGRELRHHFAWIKYFTPARIDGLAEAAGYKYNKVPKIINTPEPINRTRIRPVMSRYPKPSQQGGMLASPRFTKASPIKQNFYRPPTY